MTGRRVVLRWGLGLGLIAASGGLLRSLLWPAPLDDEETSQLRALASAFLGDADAAITILPALVARANQDRGLRRVIRRGVGELEDLAQTRSGASWLALSELERDALLEIASRAQAHSVLRVAYERLRLEVFSIHFARPQVVAGLQLPPAPQPLGFLDYKDAP